MPDPAADAFAAHCAELLSGSGAVRVRRMFGGHGLYLDGCFVAVVTARRLFLKANEETRAAFEAAGSQPFVYTRLGQAATLGYWSAPDAAFDGPEAMRPWARLALQAALAAASRARSRRRVTPRSPPGAAPAAGRRRRSTPPR
jgi:DNA transformation protein